MEAGSLEDMFAWAEAHKLKVTLGLHTEASTPWPKYTASIMDPPIMVGADTPTEALSEVLDRWIRRAAEPDFSLDKAEATTVVDEPAAVDESLAVDE